MDAIADRVMEQDKQKVQDADDPIQTAGSATFAALIEELMLGLQDRNKSINPKFFYDEEGSRLFDQITELSEYYPTRTEVGILKSNADEIAAMIGTNSVLIEPGAGNCEKVRYLLDAVRPAVYVPQDISEEFLFETTTKLKLDYPWLNIHPIVSDFNDELALPQELPAERRVVFYPGSTIGNFEPELAEVCLRRMAHLVGKEGGLVIGVDLQKERNILHAAYNDEMGVTEAFNRNVLKHVNSILDADFIPERFKHSAFYNSELSRIEMHLISDMDQSVRCGDTQINFSEGESIHTENSYKYTTQSFNALAQKSDLRLIKSWFDEDSYFSIHYLEV